MTSPGAPGFAARSPLRLTPEEGRVLGALVEKERTTPQAYPLTDSALLAACNQTTSRDPVVSYDTAVLRPAVRSLRDRGLLRTVHRTGERSDKHRHELVAALGLSPAEVALLGLLLLRGPQTLAELRARAERWHPFAGADEVEQAMAGLVSRDEPLAVRLERRPGHKESRYAEVLVDAAGTPPISTGDPTGVGWAGAVGDAAGAAGEAPAGDTEAGRSDVGRAPAPVDGRGPARAPVPVPVPVPAPGPADSPAPARLPAVLGAPASDPAHELSEEVRRLRAEVAALHDEVARLRADVKISGRA